MPNKKQKRATSRQTINMAPILKPDLDKAVEDTDTSKMQHLNELEDTLPERMDAAANAALITEGEKPEVQAYKQAEIDGEKNANVALEQARTDEREAFRANQERITEEALNPDSTFAPEDETPEEYHERMQELNNDPRYNTNAPVLVANDQKRQSELRAELPLDPDATSGNAATDFRAVDNLGKDPGSLSTAEVNAIHSADAKRMGEILDAQEKVPWLIPLMPGEDENSTETVQINGHLSIYPKGKMIQIPRQEAEILAEAYSIDTSEINQRYNLSKNPKAQEALG